MWLAERGYTASVHCYRPTSGSAPTAQSQFHVDDGGFSTCILHRLAAMVLVTLDGSESASERKAHLALGLRNAFADSKVDTSRSPRANTTTTALQRSHIHPMQHVISSYYKAPPCSLHVCSTIPHPPPHRPAPVLQADVDSR